MNTSAEINEIAKALSQAQGEIKHAIKDSKNPHYKSSYADLASVLDACKEQLSKHGLSVTQGPTKLNDSWVLITRMMHTSGQFIESMTPILNSKGDAQGFGSALTYARRYALSAIVGVAQDDDDGNAATGRPSPKVEPQTKAAEPVEQYDGKKHADLSQYVFTFGKYAGKRLGQIEMKELKSYIEFIEVSAKRTEKPITGEQAEMLANVREWLCLSEKAAQRANGAQ